MAQALPPPLAKLGAWMDVRLERIQATGLGRRLDPYLGFGELRRFNPLLALIPMALLFFFGIRRSQFGHMDTVSGIFPIMALISGLNPVTGLLSALAYGAGDLLQKFAVDDVFYHGVKTAGDYWGARLGYLVSYSALATFGVLPGVCSRAGRRIAVRVAADQRGGTSGGLPPPPVAAPASAAAAIIGSVIGGIVGSLGAAVAWKALVAPAFLLRPTPDSSCFALSGSNVIDAIPSASVAGAAGGGGATAGSGGIGQPSGGVGQPAGQLLPPGDPGLAPGGPAGPGTTSGVTAPGGSALPAPPTVAPGASSTAPAVPAPATVPAATENVVVSGPEAVTELIAAGGTPIPHGGKIYVKPPATLGGAISGIGFGELVTLPTGEQVIDPNNVAIVKKVPVPTGSTTSVQGGPAVDALVGQGFPTYKDPKGNVYVKYPPNLIHGNVTGVAVEGTIEVDGVKVIDPNKGVVILQTGPPTAPPVSSTGTGTSAGSVPAGPGSATAGPGTATTPSGPTTSTAGPASTGDATTPTDPAGPAVESEPTPPPPKPPRTPTDAKSLADSLTQPGTTVITPGNVPGFAPDVIRADGTIKVTDPKAPGPIKALDGTKAPTPSIEDGNISVAVPMGLGGVEVSLSVDGGRLKSSTATSGLLKGLEEASSFAEMMKPGSPVLDAGKSVQARIDRYNDMIAKQGLEVKSVKADGGRIEIVTGPK